MCVFTFVCVCVCIYAYVYTCIHICIQVCVCFTGFFFLGGLYFVELYSNPLHYFSHSEWMKQGEAGAPWFLSFFNIFYGAIYFPHPPFFLPFSPYILSLAPTAPNSLDLWVVVWLSFALLYIK